MSVIVEPSPVTTIAPRAATPVDPDGAAPPGSPGHDLPRRLAGAGALTFATVVVAQNLVRGSAAPRPGASGADVLDYYADHRALTTVLVATFVVGVASLATFLGGAMRTFLTSARRGWAVAGMVGAIAVIALFAGVVASEQALSVLAASGDASPATASAIWALHNSMFTVNFAFIGMALLGLSRAGVGAGVTPRVFRSAAPVGALMLAAGGIAGPYIANGQAGAMFAVGGLGFLVWLAFLVTTGLRLVRSEVSR